MRRSNSWPLLSVSDGDEPPVLLRIDSDLDIPGLDDEDDISTLEITDTEHSVDSQSSVRFNIDHPGQTLDTSFIQRKRASLVTQRHGVYCSLDVKIRLHTENQLPRLPGSALKVPGGGWVGGFLPILKSHSNSS